jgi:hypothetical protein
VFFHNLDSPVLMQSDLLAECTICHCEQNNSSYGNFNIQTEGIIKGVWNVVWEEKSSREEALRVRTYKLSIQLFSRGEGTKIFLGQNNDFFADHLFLSGKYFKVFDIHKPLWAMWNIFSGYQDTNIFQTFISKDS